MTAEKFTDIMLSLESTKKLEKIEMTYRFVKDNDIKTKYYTGLNSFKQLEIVIESMVEHIPTHFKLQFFDQILLTLIKLRLNLDSQSHVLLSKIFDCLIRY